ncbi:anaerobic ribonucleoside-triphosphate reductase [Intestinibacter sp.]|uniref:anaerobic ribonucleoside-triphosphate reductase n=1 Tax=Intestinibacter sp. TaxID=1965304 RepID=UPI003F16F6F3
MLVIKRDKSTQEFDLNKIKKVIQKTFQATGSEFTEDLWEEIQDELYLKGDFIDVEEIQDQIEQTLFDCNHLKEAKAFILYREAHKQKREKAKKNIEFIKKFIKSSNTANATIDDNSNVGTHGIGVLNAEIHKEDNQGTNMELWENKVHELYPDFDIKIMRNDFKTVLYAHDSSSQVLMPYCMAVSMYPFLLNGLKDLGGKSAVPKNIDSFCGIYCNLVFALASEVKGAVATPEFLMYMDYFCRKEWGDDYYLNYDLKIDSISKREKTIKSQIEQYFQQVTYSINQIAGSRGMQSPFTNFSFFDKYFFEGMFGEFYFPDGTRPLWESTNKLQRHYLHWLNQERLKCILTFPVCSYACLVENGEFKDNDTFEFISQEYSEGNSFFLYLSNSVDSLSSCCRLANAIQDNTFSFTNGQIGVMTGSKNVITLNLNRIIQDWYRDEMDKLKNISNIWKSNTITANLKEDLTKYIINILDRVYKYHTAYNELMWWAKDSKLFNAYDAGFIDLNKQYLTIGISGLNQAAEFLGITCNNNEEYKDFCSLIFKTIKEENLKHKTTKTQFNTEQIPGESAAIKLYNRDKKDGYWVPEDTNLYASYVFKPNDSNISILDKIILHSSNFAANLLDGGSAAHLNLSSHLSKEQYKKILNYAAKVGCKYLTFNIPNSECDDCGFITKVPIDICPKCGSSHISKYDRIIGYLTKIANWSSGRQIENTTRIRTNKDIIQKDLESC